MNLTWVSFKSTTAISFCISVGVCMCALCVCDTGVTNSNIYYTLYKLIKVFCLCICAIVHACNLNESKFFRFFQKNCFFTDANNFIWNSYGSVSDREAQTKENSNSKSKTCGGKVVNNGSGKTSHTHTQFKQIWPLVSYIKLNWW